MFYRITSHFVSNCSLILSSAAGAPIRLVFHQEMDWSLWGGDLHLDLLKRAAQINWVRIASELLKRSLYLPSSLHFGPSRRVLRLKLIKNREKVYLFFWCSAGCPSSIILSHMKDKCIYTCDMTIVVIALMTCMILSETITLVPSSCRSIT